MLFTDGTIFFFFSKSHGDHQDVSGNDDRGLCVPLINTGFHLGLHASLPSIFSTDESLNDKLTELLQHFFSHTDHSKRFIPEPHLPIHTNLYTEMQIGSQPWDKWLEFKIDVYSAHWATVIIITETLALTEPCCVTDFGFFCELLVYSSLSSWRNSDRQAKFWMW